MRIPVLKALTQRDFALLWTGQTISLFGDGIFSVALAWQALGFRDGGQALGLVLLVRSIARVATLLIGGALADRYPKRFLMLFGEGLQLATVTWLTYLVGSETVQVGQLAIVAGTTGIGSGIFLASSGSFVPELVPEEYYQSANSLRSSSLLLASEMIGPAVGGLLIAALGTTIAFGIDAATFLASMIALSLMRSRPAVEHKGTGIIKEVREGLSYVKRTPWLWTSLVVVGTVGNFAAFGPLPVLIPLIVEERLQGGADVLGLVISGYGVGGLTGALFMGSRKLRLTSVKPAYLAWAIGSAFLGVVAFAPNAWVAATAFAITGFSGQSAEVIWVTIQQTYVPGRLLGRVISTDWLVSLSLQPVGVALAAPLAGALGPGPALFGGAMVSVLAIGTGLLNKQVRHLEKPPPTARPPAPCGR